MNYSIFHVETYGHGTPERNTLDDADKVTIENYDGFYKVYECDDDEEAVKIAEWFLDTYEHYPEQLSIQNDKHDPRFFWIERAQEEIA